LAADFPILNFITIGQSPTLTSRAMAT